jgi:hypothetical protein
MSRFFRTADSTSSDSDNDSDGDEEENLENSKDVGEASNLDAIPRNSTESYLTSADWTNHHRDFLLHALLEERCMNEVRVIPCAS